MPTPPKPTLVLAAEKKSHRTKAEMNQRKENEDALLSGIEIKEWPSVKANPAAHLEFTRLKKLLKSIGKQDALYQGVINRYCLLKAECEDFETKRERFYRGLEELENAMPPGAKPMEYFKTLAVMQSQILACDKQIMAKRKMMLDIEKENIMTIASALRSIPKNPEKGGEADPMASLLGSRRA